METKKANLDFKHTKPHLSCREKACASLISDYKYFVFSPGSLIKVSQVATKLLLPVQADSKASDGIVVKGNESDVEIKFAEDFFAYWNIKHV